MPETLSPAEFEQRIQDMSERLDAKRGTPRLFSGLAGTLPYAGMDLTEELPELIPILEALLHQDPDEPLTRNARTEVAARRLALAAMQGLLSGGEGLADFPARYKQHLGQDPEYSLFEQFLPTAMREAGLSVPPRADSKRLLGVLLAAVGLPGALVEAAATYFVTYWRWFHPQEDVLAPLVTIAEAKGEVPGLAADTRKQLEALAKRLLPNATVLGPMVEGLVTVMAYLRTQARWRIGDIFAQAETIRDACGVDPKELLQGNEAALTLLTEALGHAWHPEQFSHVVTSLSRDGEVRMPNGSLTMAEKSLAIPYWGLYRIEHKTYMVLPDEGMTIEEIKALPDGITVIGNRVLWKGAEEAAVSADDWPQLTPTRHLYEERASQGWFFMAQPPAARTLQIGKDTLAPRPGVYWRTSLFAALDGEGKARLNVRVAGLRVCLPELAGSTLQLECPQSETQGRLTFELDDRGVGGLPELLLPLGEPAVGPVTLQLQDHATGDVLERDGKALTHRVQVPEIVLFNEATGRAIAPNPLEYPHGPKSLLVFADRPINTGALQMLDIGVDSLGKVGAFDVHRLRWEDVHQPLTINLGAAYTWSFATRVETIWQAGALPAAEAPLQFAAETPLGFTVKTADDLFVDDVSLVPDPLVIVAKDGEVLAAHTWAELNWMMNFPVDNRRFSGVMLRRALHVGPDFDLAGRYTLSLREGHQELGTRQLLILPDLKLAVKPAGPQDEDTSYTLEATCATPCFEGGARKVTVSLGSPVVDAEVMENSPFQPKPLETVLRLSVPLFDLRIGITPDVVGFRLLDENEGTWVRKTQISHAELGHITLVLFGAHAKSATLKVGDDEALTEEFYEGFATFSLSSVQETLKSHESTLALAIDGREVGELLTIWHPQIHHLEAVSEYLVEQVAQLEIEVSGPEEVPIRLKAFAPDGREIGTTEVTPNDGSRQTAYFDLPASRDYPVVTIKAYVPTEVSGVSSGSVEVRNASFDPEIEALNKKIGADPQAPELRYERAQLLLERGLRKAAARDFQAAIDLGMTELADSPQYQQFMSQRRAESFHEDIKAIASFFVPFARKELTIG